MTLQQAFAELGRFTGDVKTPYTRYTNPEWRKDARWHNQLIRHPGPKRLERGIDEAIRQIQEMEHWETTCEAAAWSRYFNICFWTCVLQILQAAAEVGPKNLPDVRLEDIDSRNPLNEYNVIDFGELLFQLSMAQR